MRILIVEDETAAYENLADMLVTIDPTLEIMGNTGVSSKRYVGCKPIRGRI